MEKVEVRKSRSGRTAIYGGTVPAMCADPCARTGNFGCTERHIRRRLFDQLKGGGAGPCSDAIGSVEHLLSEIDVFGQGGPQVFVGDAPVSYCQLRHKIMRRNSQFQVHAARRAESRGVLAPRVAGEPGRAKESRCG